ncbi:response regulator [Muricoccus pecuniae]|uniref:histidine kinase n=1 Tax=Muricoccus pecuniae TaxID=693023 RepID=A0A840Y5H5_9PROT|nr:response regulator [Roseomonas pecuniae]MBB5695070.1 light-regulated signal transduction histidine kinase (bacteriophytochrome)/ActR/RegA family two-component response regulator [Roseomonas pecuniae]
MSVSLRPARLRGLAAQPMVPPEPDRADTLCAQEPIHIPGAIQPHGVLLVADPSRNLVIRAASENAGLLAEGLPSNTLLGLPVADVLGEEFAKALGELAAAGELRGETPWETGLDLPGGPFEVTSHTQDGMVLIELEPVAPRDEEEALGAARALQRAIARLRAAGGRLEELARVTVEGIRHLTGYERVLIYRFDQDWHGQTLAEDKVADWEQSLDGLHFPASDIPAQARELYRRSLIRWVPSRDAAPVPLHKDPSWEVPEMPERPIDLSFTRLRSLSPVHLQYHRNMGVDGSMSLSILHEGQLWGLMVCHHRRPHRPSPGQRAAATALTDAFALRVGGAEQHGVEEARRADMNRLAELTAHMAEADDVTSALTAGAVTIASFFGCRGAALLRGATVERLGEAPPAPDLLRLANWLRDRGGEDIFHSDRMSADFPDWAQHATLASGVLAVFLTVDRTDMILWFRPEEPYLVSWGGNPHKAMDPQGGSVLPRQSFERWVEERHGHSRPWAGWELEIAATLRHAITEVIIRSLGRIAELNERLRQSQKMEAVGQLTGGIAHDFNNLLAGIVGSLEMMRNRVAQGRVGELDRYLGAAMTSANRAAALTHRLLAFSRRQTLDPKPTDVNRLVTSMEELIRRTVGPAIHVETVMSGGLWTTLCDANQLENALLNLAINARDAMPDGGRLTIEAVNARLDDAYARRHHEVTAGQYVAVSVTDTGTGMPPEVVARAFDPFFTTKPLGQGTGLGLSMVYGFAKQSNGYVRIYSEAGQGTTVRLYLPRSVEAEGADADAARPTLDQAAPEGGTVLVVDDEPVVRMLVTEVLRDLGYGVVEASDGPQALKALEAMPKIDLMVTDVGLPGGMNGRQLADAVRERRPALKVLFITGYAENAAIGNGLLAPGMQVITKPFAMDVLATKVRSMTEG